MSNNMVDDYLQAKYSSGWDETGNGPESERFEVTEGEIHASRVAECERQHWLRENGDEQTSSVSPYFELGRMMEVVHGAILAYRYDSKITGDVLKNHPPWEVAEMSDVVQQDVDIAIEICEINDGNTLKIVGQTDWVVFREREYVFDKITLKLDGTREAILPDGSVVEVTDPAGAVKRVYETKTIGETGMLMQGGLEPKEKHQYQVESYMRAIGQEATVAYLERDTLDEVSIDVSPDELLWEDIRVRTLRKHKNRQYPNSPPPHSPLNSYQGRYCDCTGD